MNVSFYLLTPRVKTGTFAFVRFICWPVNGGNKPLESNTKDSILQTLCSNVKYILCFSDVLISLVTPD